MEMQMTTHAQAPSCLAPRMTRTANLNPGLAWPEFMQVQLSKSNNGDALSHIKQGARNRQLPPTVVAARTMGAMLDLALKQPGPTSPCVLPRHPLVRFVSGESQRLSLPA